MNNKHRGKRIETGEWIYGYLIGDNVIVGEIVDWNDEYFNTEYWYAVDPATVGKYIGIKDGTNNDEWCVGDILTPNPHLHNQEVQIICYDSHQAKYKSVPLSTYRTNAGNGGWTGYDIKYWQRRLGNIHDNPELLEVQR
ncbi:YopX family protein [Paenibacillus sp. USHLN196]|uniref:YopX family protein n=1 Tax=Paenibacillus sp. USHLN196 TaxID=3081291 RepID=UPI00301A1F11